MIGSVRVYGVGEKMFRRLVAVVLVGEAFVFFFAALVAWATHRGADEPGVAYLVVGCALAVLCFVTSGLLRRPWGITIGWVLQAAMLVSSVILTSMLFLAVIFLAMWFTALVQGDKMDELTRRRAEV